MHKCMLETSLIIFHIYSKLIIVFKYDGIQYGLTRESNEGRSSDSRVRIEYPLDLLSIIVRVFVSRFVFLNAC